MWIQNTIVTQFTSDKYQNRLAVSDISHPCHLYNLTCCFASSIIKSSSGVQFRGIHMCANLFACRVSQ